METTKETLDFVIGAAETLLKLLADVKLPAAGEAVKYPLILNLTHKSDGTLRVEIVKAT